MSSDISSFTRYTLMKKWFILTKARSTAKQSDKQETVAQEWAQSLYACPNPFDQTQKSLNWMTSKNFFKSKWKNLNALIREKFKEQKKIAKGTQTPWRVRSKWLQKKQDLDTYCVQKTARPLLPSRRIVQSCATPSKEWTPMRGLRIYVSTCEHWLISEPLKCLKITVARQTTSQRYSSNTSAPAPMTKYAHNSMLPVFCTCIIKTLISFKLGQIYVLSLLNL